MENAEDFDTVQLGSDTIRNDMGCSGDYQLAGAVDAAGTAKGRILPQEADDVGNALNQRMGSGRILSGNVLGFVVQIP